MFKYVRYTPFTDEFTTYQFNNINDKCTLHSFDVPFISVEYTDGMDYTELLTAQNPLINAVEITKDEFEAAVRDSSQVHRMYDIANEQYRQECSVLTAKYTPEEISTWAVQVAEAEAIKLGQIVATPFLSALAVDDGITIAQAADKILMLRDANANYTAGALSNKWTRLKALKAEVGL